MTILFQNRDRHKRVLIWSSWTGFRESLKLYVQFYVHICFSREGSVAFCGLSKDVDQKNPKKTPLKSICLGIEVLGRLGRRSDIEVCLEARTWTCGNGWGGTSKKSSVNKEVQAGSMREQPFL